MYWEQTGPHEAVADAESVTEYATQSFWDNHEDISQEGIEECARAGFYRLVWAEHSKASIRNVSIECTAFGPFATIDEAIANGKAK